MMKTGLITQNVKMTSARGLTVMALLTALSTILMLFEIPLWFAPGFYKIDFSEVPILIGAFALGPIAGVLMEFVKIMINLLINGTITAGVGEFANFILGCALVVPSAMIYQVRKNKKFATIGMGIGTISFIIIGCALNAFVLLPTYGKAFGMPIESLIAMGSAVNPRITSMSTFIFLAVAPFNFLKGFLVSVITALLYKYVAPMIKGYH